MAQAAGAQSLAQRKARQRVTHLGGRPKKYQSNAAKQRAYRDRAKPVQDVTKPGARPFISLELQTPGVASATTLT